MKPEKLYMVSFSKWHLTFFIFAISLGIFIYGCGGSGENPAFLSPLTSDSVEPDPAFDENYIKTSAASFKTTVEEEKYFEQLVLFLNRRSASASSSNPFVPTVVVPGATLSSISLDKTKDSIDLQPSVPASYDLSKIVVTAEMSDKATKTVQASWYIYAGEGTLVENIYTPPAKNAAVALVAEYSEGAITRSAVLRLAVTSYDGLRSIELSSDRYSLPAHEETVSFDLSSIAVTANYGSNSSRDATSDPMLTWNKISGPGTLTGKIYTASNEKGQAVFEAAFTEDGATRYARFTLRFVTVTGISVVKVKKEKPQKRLLAPSPILYAVTGIITDPNSERILISSPGPTTFACSTVQVIANNDDGSTTDVTLNSKTTWVLSSGLGAFDTGTEVYTATATPETAVLQARYKPGGTTYTSNFSLYVVALSSISLSPSSDSINSSQTYDLAGVAVTANYSDSATANVTASTGWTKLTGAGTLSGTVYTAPASGETATFQASYTENGVNKTATFTLTVNAVTLDYITLSPSSADSYVYSGYNLSAVTVTAHYVGGATATVTPSWTKTSGAGTLTGTEYYCPTVAETASFQASYTEGGITRTASFTLNVLMETVLLSTTLSPTSANINSSQTYDLAAVTVSAGYNDIAPQDVSSSATWTKISGAGTLSGKVYTATAAGETAVVRASYTENSVTKTADFTITVIALSSISLSPSSGDMTISSTYDLATNIAVTATYSDSSTGTVTGSTTWTKLSGLGTLSGSVYTATASAETASLRASYTFAGVTKTADFSLNVISQGIYLTPASGRVVIASPGPATYNCSTVTVTYFNGGSTTDVTSNSKTTWSQISGAGSFNATTKVYTATSSPETAVLRAQYKPGGTAYIKDFNLSVVSFDSITLSPSSDSIYSNQTYDLAGVAVTANYSDTVTQTVTSSATWTKLSGGGTLSGKVYTPPSSSETATFQASYTNSGVTKTATFTLTVTALTLNLISLSPSSADSYVYSSYNLSAVTVTATYVGGTTATVTPSWSKLTGAGTLTGTEYACPTAAETATFQASYTENGVTKTADFTLNVLMETVLLSISLSPTSANINSSQTYDLSAVTVTAAYNDISPQNVTSSATWTKVSGAGTLSGKVYTATAAGETAIMRASYTENSVTKTADFNIYVKALSSISLSPSSATMPISTAYDLAANVAVTATYSDSSTVTVTGSTTWTKLSGLGTLAGSVYTATASAETASLRASYTFAGVTRTSDFTLTVENTGIYLTPSEDRLTIANPGPAVYNGSTVTVTYFNGGSTTDVTNNSKTTWSLISGAGSFNPTTKVYTATASPETVTLRAQYKPGGIAYIKDFTLKVVSLSSISLSPSSASINGNQTYDLSSVAVAANYSDSYTKSVTGSTTWTKLSGAGTLAGTTYTAPTNTETATFQASYTESGVNKTATFTLNVTGLTLDTITLSPTSADINASQTYDLATVAVTANFVGGYSKTVTSSASWTKLSGAGTLAGKVYTAPASSEIATFQAGYTESGVNRTETFTINVSNTVLDYISLSPTSANINGTATYDLAGVAVTAYYVGGASGTVTGSTTWSKLTGAGTLAGKVYTAPSYTETATFQASYTEAAVTKTATFTVNVTGLVLDTLSLSPTSANISGTAAYDLAAVAVTANFVGGYSKAVTSSATWTKLTGDGTLAGKVYTAPSNTETATFQASYTESGVTKTTTFTINVTGLVLDTISLSPTSANINGAATYDLAGVAVTANFVGGYNKTVTSSATWTKLTGDGTLAGKVYTAPSYAETATFQASYTESGVTKTTTFTINVTALTLDTLSLVPVSEDINGAASYNLTNVEVMANFVGGHSKNVTGSTIWSKLSGDGTLAGTVYTAPSYSETSTFQASYTESGVTKTATFTISVTGLDLDTLTLAPVSADINGAATYDLVTPVATANFVGGYNKVVTGSTTWSKLTGNGTLVGTVYTAPSYAETATFQASYTEGAVTKTATFTINVTGLTLNSLTLAPVSADINGAATYDLATPVATANFVGGHSKSVTATWTKLTGAGTLVGTVYTAPSNTETATFEASYTEGAVTKTATFTINVTGLVLDTISLSPVSTGINGTANYDLANVAVTANFVGGYNKTVTSSATWTKLTGAGTLAGKVYTAPSNTETATFEASYTETGVTKTATFTINVTGLVLDTLSLSPVSTAINANETYDLAVVAVTANFVGGYNKSVTSSATWTKLTGAGTLAGTVYTASTVTEAATFQASYTESGVTKTATFTINVTGLVLDTISLLPVSADINGAATYDLAGVAVTANFVGGYNKSVTSSATWSKLTGAGTLAGKVYTAPSYTETATFEASYTESGVTKTATFTINVTGLALDTITLSPASAVSYVNIDYDLADVAVTANFVGGHSKTVTSSAVWTKLTGSGTLTGKVYTSPAIPETATFEASYTESGITRTATFTLSVIDSAVLTSISLSHSSADIQLAYKTYDLGTVTVTANYSDMSTTDVTQNAATIWSLVSGLGTLNSNIYTSTATKEAATFQVSFTANGVTKTADFTVNVIDTIAPSVVLSDAYTVNDSKSPPDSQYYVPWAAQVLIYANFTENDQIDEVTKPKITIKNSAGTTILAATSMTKDTTVAKRWKYIWTVPGNVSYRWYNLTITAKDRSGNSCTPATGLNKYVIYNPSTLTSPWNTPPSQ